MATAESSGPLKFRPSRDPIVWAFLALLGLTLAFSAFGAYQNNRIASALREMYQYNHDQLEYVRTAVERRQAEIDAERKAMAKP